VTRAGAAAVTLTQRRVRTPSPSGQEGPAAELLGGLVNEYRYGA
jgi:hypothetical protein